MSAKLNSTPNKSLIRHSLLNLSQNITSKPLPHELLKFIPHYDGSAYKLPNFLKTLDELFSGYCTDTIVEKDHNHWLIFKAALSKLEGPAEAVAFNNNCSILTD